MPSAYDALILSESGLIHYYKLDEASGTMAVDSKGSANGTCTGVTFAQTGLVADGSTAARLSGSSSSINLGTPFPPGISNAFSVEFIFKLNSTASFQCLYQNGQDTHGNSVWLNTSSNLSTSIDNNTNYSGVTLTSGVWHHAVFTYSSFGGWNLYIDGVQEAFASVFGIGATATGTNYIGRFNNTTGSPALDGYLQKFAYYDTVVTPTQVSNHYAAISATSPPYTFTGPSSFFAGVADTFTLTGSAGDTSLISLSDGGAGGTFAPTSLHLNNTTPVTFTYTNSTPGVRTLTVTRASGGPDPTPIEVTNPPTTIDTGDGTYCGGSHSVSFSGKWVRSNGIPHKQEWITLFYLSCGGSHYVNNLGNQVLHGTTEYCSDSDVLIITAQTDCSGNYTFTIPSGSVLAAGIAPGKYVSNPVYDPDNPTPGLITYVQYILDTTTSYRYDRAVTGGFPMNVTGPHWFYGFEVGGTSTPDNGFVVGAFQYGLDPSGFSDSAIFNGGADTPCGDNDPPHNPLYGFSRQDSNVGFFSSSGTYVSASWAWRQGWFNAVNFDASLPRHTPLVGSFTYDIHDAPFSSETQLTTYTMRGGNYYLLINYPYTVVDSCGTTDTTTAIGTTPVGESQVLVAVDSSNISSITRIHALPTPGWTDGYPGSDPNIYGPYPSPLTTGVSWTYGDPLPPLLYHDVRYPTPINIILPPAPIAQTISADYSNGVITLAWITEAGSLKISSHRSMAKYHNHGEMGWDAPFVSTSANVTTLGMSYINDKTLRVFATVGGVITSFTNNAFAQSSAWQAGVTCGIAELCKGTRTRARSCASIPHGNHADFAVDNRNDGTFLSTSTMVTAVSGFTLDYNRAWVEDFGSVYVCLSSKSTILGVTVVLFNRSLDGGAIWGAIYGDAYLLTGRLATMAKTNSSVLVALMYDPSAKKYTCARSYNQGLNWVQDTTTIGTMDNIFPPPVLVNTTQGLYACYVQNDQPKFLFSSDVGFEWI